MLHIIYIYENSVKCKEENSPHNDSTLLKDTYFSIIDHPKQLEPPTGL